MRRAMREVDNGVPVSVVCRKARRLRELEEESQQLKKLLSEQMLHNDALREVLSYEERMTRDTSARSLVRCPARCFAFAVQAPAVDAQSAIHSLARASASSHRDRDASRARQKPAVSALA
jgi:hypothetical protein